MQKYSISEELVREALEKPDSIVQGNFGREIYQKRLNGYVVRIIIEEDQGLFIVVTLYTSRVERYEV